MTGSFFNSTGTVYNNNKERSWRWVCTSATYVKQLHRHVYNAINITRR